MGMVKNGWGQSGHRVLKLAFFSMLVQIQESQKLIQWFLDGPGQKWQWSFSSWEPKICCILRMNIWADYLNTDSDTIVSGQTDILLFDQVSTAVVLLVFQRKYLNTRYFGFKSETSLDICLPVLYHQDIVPLFKWV